MFVIVEEFVQFDTAYRPLWVFRDKAAAEKRLADLQAIEAIGMPSQGLPGPYVSYYDARYARAAAYVKLVGAFDPPIDYDASWNLYEVQEV